MNDMKLGVIETKFAEIIWQHEPLPSGSLVKLCQEALGWKKPTTYNVLRKLCEKRIFQNLNGIVTSRISRNDFFAMQGETLVNDGFEGSLPAFIAAFTSRKSLTPQEAAEIRRMIDAFEE